MIKEHRHVYKCHRKEILSPIKNRTTLYTEVKNITQSRKNNLHHQTLMIKKLHYMPLLTAIIICNTVACKYEDYLTLLHSNKINRKLIYKHRRKPSLTMGIAT